MSNPTTERQAGVGEGDNGKQLRETREWLEIALEASGMGVFDVDLETMTARTTLRHNQIFGYTEPVDAWSPEIFREHVVEEDRDVIDPAIERALDTGSFDLTARVRWPDGSIHWMRDWGRVYRDEDGRPVRLVGVTQEITARKRAEERLLRAKRQAEEATRAKGRLLAVMSHELRSPLSGIIGSANLMEMRLEEGATAANLAALRRVRSTAWHMASVIDDILALARSEAGHEEVHLAEADVSVITRNVLEILRPQAELAGPSVRLVGFDHALPARTDVGKVRQILMNLVGNALKHTDSGEVTVRADATPEGEIRIAVQDTGPGIPAEDRARIFEPFTRLNGAASGPGSGLGLAISRRLARLLGGDVTLGSDGGPGSTFTLRLPARVGPGSERWEPDR